MFHCDKPGVPRVGPPRKSSSFRLNGVPVRRLGRYVPAFPTDGRAHGNIRRWLGDSVGRWEGDTFVVDVTNFLEDGWFGEGGYFHTDKMHVTERLWRDGENLVWQATVEDPNVLTAPWTIRPKVVKPSTEALSESPRCVEDDGKLLLNNDHHQQR